MMGTDFHTINLMLVPADREKILNTKITSSQNLNDFVSGCSNWHIDKSSANGDLSLQLSTKHDCAAFKNEEFYKNKNNNRPKNMNEQFSGFVIWNLGCASLLAYHK